MSTSVVRDFHEKRLRAARADERIMAALIPGRGYGWSGGLMQGDRITQVQQMQNWFGVGTDIIAKLAAQIVPNIAYVRSQAVAGKTQKWFTHNYEHMRDLNFGGHSIVSGSYRRKALSVIKPHEELEPVEANHPLRRLQEDPNPWDTQFDHDYELIMYQYLNGVAYDWAAPSGFRNEQGVSIPRGLWCMPTPWVWPRTGAGELVNPNNPYADHIISYYEIRPFGMGTAGAGVIRLPPDQIIRYAFKSPINKIDGLAKTWTGRNWLDADNSIAKSQYAQMSNIARPSLFLKLGEGYEDPGDDEIERILAKFRQRNVGELNMGNPFVGTPGMEPIPLDFPPLQMAYGEAMDQSRDRILALLNVPKSAVGLSDSMTFGSILATLMQLCTFGVNPLLAANGQTRTKFLASVFSTRENRIKIWYDDCTPPDPDQLNKDIDTDAKWGAITPNEIRAIRSRQPYKNGGDDPIMPMGNTIMPLNTGDDLSDLAELVPLLGRQENPAAEEEEAESGLGSPQVEEPNGSPSKRWGARLKDFNPDQPRGQPGNPGQFGPGSGVPTGKPAKPSGSGYGIISKLGSSTWEGLKKAGYSAKQVEHCAKEWVESKAEQNVSKLPNKMQTAVKGTWLALRIGGKATFTSYRAGQAAAEAVAKRRGASPEQAARLRAVLSTIDLATFKPVSIGMSMAAGPAVAGAASFIPLGSATYLAYSTVRDPVAVFRTIADQVKKVAAKLGLSKSGNNDKLLDQVYDCVETDEGMARFLAALDVTQDVGKALKVVKAAGPRSGVPSLNGAHK